MAKYLGLLLGISFILVIVFPSYGTAVLFGVSFVLTVISIPLVIAFRGLVMGEIPLSSTRTMVGPPARCLGGLVGSAIFSVWIAPVVSGVLWILSFFACAICLIFYKEKYVVNLDDKLDIFD